MIMRNVTGKVLRIGMVLWLAGSLGACTELDEGRVNGNSQLQVRLTDAPGDFDAVFIDVSGVLIHRSATDVAGAEDGGWERIDGVKSGVYNLLELVNGHDRSEEHTSELQSLMHISYAVFCLKKKKKTRQEYTTRSLDLNSNIKTYNIRHAKRRMRQTIRTRNEHRPNYNIAARQTQ